METQTLSNLYVRAISIGMEALAEITDPYSKAVAAAKIAGSIAMTNIIKVDESSAPVEETAKKTRKKTAEAPIEPVAVAEVVEEAAPALEATPSVEATEWDDESAALFATELDFINQTVEAHGLATVNEWLGVFSSELLTSCETDITPQNVRAFYLFLVQPQQESA
jgi:hypothetical protein